MINVAEINEEKESTISDGEDINANEKKDTQEGNIVLAMHTNMEEVVDLRNKLTTTLETQDKLKQVIYCTEDTKVLKKKVILINNKTVVCDVEEPFAPEHENLEGLDVIKRPANLETGNMQVLKRDKF